MSEKITAESISWDNYLLSQASKATVIEVVSENGNMLQHASLEMANDRDVVLAAVKQNGLALRFASSRLKRDPELILMAVKQNALAFQFVSFELRNNKDFVMAVVETNGLAFKYVSNKLKSDEDVAWAAVCQNKESFRFVGDSIKSYIGWMLAGREQQCQAEKLQEEVFQESSESKEMSQEELSELLTGLEGDLNLLENLNMADMSIEEKLDYLKKKDMMEH